MFLQILKIEDSNVQYQSACNPKRQHFRIKNPFRLPKFIVRIIKINVNFSSLTVPFHYQLTVTENSGKKFNCICTSHFVTKQQKLNKEAREVFCIFFS
jgi:hypothetical protein